MADHEVVSWLSGERVGAPCACAIGQNHLRWVRPLLDEAEEDQ